MTNEILKAAEITIKTCMGLKKGETLLVIGDYTCPLNVVDALVEEGRKVTKEVMKLIMVPREVSGEEPPAMIAQAMLNADVVLIPTTRSLTHTDARRNASKKGVRIASMPGVTEEMFTRLMQSDYADIKKGCDKLVQALNDKKEVVITAPNGTNFRLVLGNEFEGDPGIICEKGNCGNLPAGEVYGAPVECKGEGVIVVDRMGDIIMEPTKIEFKCGKIVFIEPTASGKKYMELLEKVKSMDGNENAYMIGELGIGLNPNARVSGNMLEDEKVLGTCHLAFGSNTSFPGGTISCSIHEDGIVKSPTIVVDGKKIMDGGKLLV